ncbi:MAG: hypothetical protein HYT39_04220, partial [Candidatus Sungbacteria bacterium]|nr:hypothetical protein [Candidatus Sungbacteria bacterium]
MTVSNTAWVNKLAVTGTATTTLNSPITSFSGNFIIAGDSASNLFLNPYGGNIGIGTTSSGNLLSVHSSGNVYFGGALTVSGQTNLVNASTSIITAPTLFSTNGTITNASTTLATLPTFWGTTGTITNASTTYVTAANNFWGNIGQFTTLLQTPLIWNDGTLTASTTGANPLIFATNSSERMRIDESGKVVIATTTMPSGFGLNIATSTFVYGDLTVSGNSVFKNASTTNGTITNLWSMDLVTTNATTTTFRSDGLATFGGNVGIGTTTPGQLLSVNGNGFFAGDLTVATTTYMTNASTTYATIPTFWSTAGQITNASTTYLTVSNAAWLGAATSTSLGVTSGAQLGSLNVSGITALGYLTATNSTSTNLFSTSGTITNASTTNLTVSSTLFANTASTTNLKLPITGLAYSSSSGATIVGTSTLDVLLGGSGATTLSGFLYGNGSAPFTGTTTPFFTSGIFAGGNSTITNASTTYLTVSNAAWLGAATSTSLGVTSGSSFAGATFSGNVGIGETAPGSKLSVSGGGSFGAGYDTTAAPTNGLIIEGNVGIGTSTPEATLHVYHPSGNGIIMQTSASPQLNKWAFRLR